MMRKMFENLKYDLPASIVVFFVAVPLCLGIALASGAPLFSGIIAGIVGGIVVGSASGSALGVSGPAAGLTAVVISTMALFNNSWEAFLLAVFIAGIFQIIAGLLGGGVIAYYFPSSVIKGMLVGIGIIIILKQIPYALGLEHGKGGMDSESINHMFTQLIHITQSIKWGPTFITALSVMLLVIWDNWLVPKYKFFQLLQGPIAVVFIGIGITWLIQKGMIPINLGENELVNIPVPSSIAEFYNQFYFPDFSLIFNIDIYKSALVIALIASLETLLCVEATDKMDPEKRITPTDRELKAQGIGNMICGLIGGLPITQVIVRSSANITFGARSKLSTIYHGFLLLLCVVAIPEFLNMIPLATLAAILFVVGYKLAKPMIFKQMYNLGWEQFVPFLATVIGVVVEDLLMGIGIGMTIAIFIILLHNYRNSHNIFQYEVDDEKKIHLSLAEQVSFLNKGSIIHEIRNIPPHSKVIIDFSQNEIIDYDVIEAIDEFIDQSKRKNITVECIGRTEHVDTD